MWTNYQMLNIPFNKVNTLAPLFPIYGLLNIFEVFAGLIQSEKHMKMKYKRSDRKNFFEIP